MAEYCLRWNNHLPNLVNVFTELLSAEGLVDVTLATDGHYIRAHKLVLSACSVYFKDLFGLNPCTHPIVFLKDIRFEDLRTVIDFIYKGEVNVAQDRLPDVLKTAESLKIKGLADRPFTTEDQSSQLRGTHLSSSFSSQRSSLADSRDQVASTEAEDAGEPCGSPANKRRKIVSQDSTESQQDSGHDSEERPRNVETKEDTRPSLSTIDEEKLKAISSDLRDKIKEENDTSQSERNPEQQESGAVDAMLLLQGSSSENEAGGSVTGTSTNNGRESTSSLLGSHSQARSKRGVLKRQPGIIREAATEEKEEDRIPQPEYSLSDSITVTSSLSSSEYIFPNFSGHTFDNTGNSRLLQVPAVVVGSPHDTTTFSPLSSFSRQYSKPLLAVPSTSSQMIRQHSQPLSSTGVTGPPPMAKQRSHPSVLTHTMTQPYERIQASKLSTPQQQVSLVPMQLITKQKSSLGSPQSLHSHLRPIQPKPCEVEMGLLKKETPLIHLTTEEDILCQTRFARAVSEEPLITRTTGLDLLSPGSTPLIQSVSQDTGLDAAGPSISRLALPSNPTIGLSRLTVTTPTVPAAHTPVLREGPALGCNYCWNTQDNQGRVQRRKTKYHCPDCRTNLCIVPCFHEYHSQMQVKQDQQKQINKMLTKTTSM